MRILILISLLCSIAFSAPVLNGAEATQTVTINHLQVAETSSDFLFQLKIPRVGALLTAVESADDVAFTNTNDTTRRARWVVYTPDTIFLYAHIAVSSTSDTSYRLQYGKSLNETNAASTFTNCGITSYWGFNEQSGTTVADYANGLALTVGGGSTLGNAGVFYNALTGGASGYASVSNAVMSGKTSFTHSMLINVIDYVNTTIFTVAREASNIRYQVNVSAASNLFVYIGSTFNYGKIPITDLLTGFPQILTIVFDGSQPTNETKLKIYVDGVAKTITFTGTIPASIPTYTASPLFNIGGYSGGSYYVKGIVDEMYLASQTVTEGHEADRFNMLFNPSTFSTLGTPLATEFSAEMGIDTLRLVCSAENALTYQWYDNNVAVIGATDSVYTIYADSTFYSIKHVIYCLVNGTVKSGEWVFQLSTTGSRRSGYRQINMGQGMH